MRVKSDGVNKDGLDQLEKLLKSNPEIKEVNRPEDKERYFNRNITFKIRDIEYRIEWYINLMHLYIGNFEVLFNEVRLSNTYPRHYKNFLQFYIRDELVAVLPLEEY